MDFELTVGGYVRHRVYAKRLPDGRIACIVECVIARELHSCWGVLLTGKEWQSYEVYSEPDAIRWWYGYSSEAALIEAIIVQVDRLP